MSRALLVLNAGSSSIKFALYPADKQPLPPAALWRGQISNLHGAVAHWQADDEQLDVHLDPQAPYQQALHTILQRLQQRGLPNLLAVVHRVVHGGAHFFAPTVVNEAVLAELRSYVPLAPLHQPHAIDAIAACLQLLPDLPQIACFDTAFHQSLPEVEQMLPLPQALREQGLRRYGFHGLSYHYLAQTLAELEGEQAQGRVLCAHLGSGASLCAMQGLRSVATTMGFSALDGLMMGSRCGSIDPGVLLYLLQSGRYDVAGLSALLYHDSGLRGVSGLSDDVRVLLAQEEHEPAARQALALYQRRIVRECGALVAVLGGLDLLVFSAGVGEHSAELRRRICADLAWLGLQLDEVANQANAAIISSPTSTVKVRVLPTNEECLMASQALGLLRSMAR